MLDWTAAKLEMEKARLVALLFRRCAEAAWDGVEVGEGVCSMRSRRLAAVLPMVASRSSAWTIPVAAASRTLSSAASAKVVSWLVEEAPDGVRAPLAGEVSL